MTSSVDYLLPQKMMVPVILILLTSPSLVMMDKTSEQPAPRIAIIGAGIGGASASHFLRELFGPDGATIDVYEAREVGGRIASIDLAGHVYEVGASVIHPANKYMEDFVNLLGLKKKKSTGGGRFGLFNGKEFVFKEGNWDLINQIHLLWRYGFSLLKLKEYIADVMDKFIRIYSHQDSGEMYNTVEELLTSMDPIVLEVTHISTQKGLLHAGISDLLISELVMAALRVNYGQTTAAQELVGLVSTAGAQKGVWSVDGGNKQIPVGLLKQSGAHLLNKQVSTVLLQDDNKFVVESVNVESPASVRNDDFQEEKSSETEENPGVMTRAIYDVVIVATPIAINMSTITFVNFPKIFNFTGSLHQTVATLVHGKINCTSFGFLSNDEILDQIFIINNDIIVNSVARNYPVTYDDETMDLPEVWKVFSQRPLFEEELNYIFSSRYETKAVDWLAYPHYVSSDILGNFTLYKNLYYINSIEWAASAMEMVSIGGRNVALLTYKNWMGLDHLPEKKKKMLLRSEPKRMLDL